MLELFLEGRLSSWLGRRWCFPCSLPAGQGLAPKGPSCGCEEHAALVRWKGWPTLISMAGIAEIKEWGSGVLGGVSPAIACRVQSRVCEGSACPSGSCWP